MVHLQGRIAWLLIVVGKVSGLSLATERIGDVRSICEVALAETIGDDLVVSRVTAKLTSESAAQRMTIQALINSRVQFMERSRYRRMPWRSFQQRVYDLVKEIYEGEFAVALNYGNTKLEGSTLPIIGSFPKSD